MAYELKDKVVIITGASSGIGKATAWEFAREKAIVILASRKEEKLQELAEEIKKIGSQILVVKTDVSLSGEIEHLVNITLEKYGRIDILVNNAGFGNHSAVEDTPIQDMKDVLDTNLLGPFYAMRLVIPIMKKQGYGRIINISSVIGRRGIGFSGAYCASKFGLIGLTESTQVELRGSPVKICTVCPGLTDTDFGFNMREPVRQTKENVWAKGVPAKKVARVIVRCVKKPKREIYISWYDHAMVYVNALFPGFIEFILGIYRQK